MSYEQVKAIERTKFLIKYRINRFFQQLVFASLLGYFLYQIAQIL